MPAHKAMGFVERVKNEVHQTRIPNMSGGGTKVVDAAYNPLSIMEDYFFAQTAEGRGSKVEVLPGGENLGEIDDLKYFNNKLMRGYVFLLLINQLVVKMELRHLMTDELVLQ